MKNTLFMLVIGLFFGVGIGFLIAQGVEAPSSHDHSAHGAPHDDNGPMSNDDMAGHDHSAKVEAGTPAPTISATITGEPGGLNIHLKTENFRFTPEHVNKEHIQGEGHAHIYVNGDKKMRAYGRWVNVTGLAPGPAEVRITLNANSHEELVTNGIPIEFVTTAIVE